MPKNSTKCFLRIQQPIGAVDFPFMTGRVKVSPMNMSGRNNEASLIAAYTDTPEIRVKATGSAVRVGALR